MQPLLGEARVAGWPEHRRAAIEDMVVFMRNSETTGLLTDLNEDVCYNCSCSGGYLCDCDVQNPRVSYVHAQRACCHTHKTTPTNFKHQNNYTGDLLCCDACSAAYHLSCAGLWQLPEEHIWLCNRCKKGATRSKRDAVQRERATGARA